MITVSEQISDSEPFVLSGMCRSGMRLPIRPRHCRRGGRRSDEAIVRTDSSRQDGRSCQENFSYAPPGNHMVNDAGLLGTIDVCPRLLFMMAKKASSIGSACQLGMMHMHRP